MMVVTLLTLLCIYRLINYKVKPDLDTIVSPHDAKEKTLVPCEGVKDPFGQALTDLFGINPLLKLNNPRLIMLESAGPNAVKSA